MLPVGTITLLKVILLHPPLEGIAAQCLEALPTWAKLLVNHIDSGITTKGWGVKLGTSSVKLSTLATLATLACLTKLGPLYRGEFLLWLELRW